MESQHLQSHVLKQAFAATRGALVIADCNAKDMPIIYCNQAFIELTGYSEDEIVGRNCRFLQGEETDQTSIDKIREAINKAEDIRITLRNYKKDGTPFWNDLIMSPIKDTRGKLTHFIGMQLDITETIEYQESLKASKEELENINAELEQFTYAASHDLQEPLRMVASFLQLIQKRYDDQLDAEGKEFINYALEGSERMQRMIADLLQLSRVRTKAQPFSEINLTEMIEQVLLNLRVAINETKAKITYDKKMPTVVADATQLSLLLQNLISNAIKYRDFEQQPQINVQVTEDEFSWSIDVSDNGIGIDPNYHERIFEVFQRLHTREEYPGNGVGLAICKKIAERHGGTLSVTSSINDGSTFYFRLPKPQEESL